MFSPRTQIALAFATLLASLPSQTAAGTAPAAPVDTPRDRLRSEEYFGRGTIVEFRITLNDEARESLRKEPRKYVQARLSENGKEVGVVGVKLKGS